MNPKITVWKEAPEVGIPELPSLFYADDALLLAYESVEGTYPIIRFDDVIDYRLSPINDEGLGKHKYAKYGLRFYSFHELTETDETKKWSALGARQWVVTFKDVTLDVLAESVSIVNQGITSSDPKEALWAHINKNETKC